jgi:hypothetical protein
VPLLGETTLPSVTFRGADFAVDRGADLGVAEIDLGGFQLSLGGVDLRCQGTLIRDRLVDALRCRPAGVFNR